MDVEFTAAAGKKIDETFAQVTICESVTSYWITVFLTMYSQPQEKVCVTTRLRRSSRLITKRPRCVSLVLAATGSCLKSYLTVAHEDITHTRKGEDLSIDYTDIVLGECIIILLIKNSIFIRFPDAGGDVKFNLDATRTHWMIDGIDQYGQAPQGKADEI